MHINAASEGGYSLWLLDFAGYQKSVLQVSTEISCSHFQNSQKRKIRDETEISK
jgi:hypothetical protein